MINQLSAQQAAGQSVDALDEHLIAVSNAVDELKEYARGIRRVRDEKARAQLGADAIARMSDEEKRALLGQLIRQVGIEQQVGIDVSEGGLNP